MDFLNLDLLSVGIAVAGTLVLGFSVFLSNTSNLASRTFFFFTIITAVWGALNYISYKLNYFDFTLWSLRAVLFLAVWQAFAVFQFSYVFPDEKKFFSPWRIRVLLLLAVLVSFLTLTPYTFTSIGSEVLIAPGITVPSPVPGPGIVIFGLASILLVVASIYILIKKTKKASGTQRLQYAPILAGALAMFSLIIVFNFLLPVLVNDVRFIPFGALFTFPFVALTSYSILKRKLFNVKVAGAGLLVFALAITAFGEVIFAQELFLVLYRASIFVLVLSFGILLVRSVIKEIKQREKLEILSAELESANKELKKLDQLKSDFLSFATHQLRSPLTVTKGYISMIIEGSYGKAGELVLEKLKRVYESNERLIKLVDDFLNLSRIEQGRMQYDFSRSSIEDIAEEVVDELKDPAKKKGLEIFWQKSFPPLPQTVIDASKMHEVIYNLIDNAIKYTQSGKITVKTEKAGTFLRLSVSDTGIGLESEDKDRLFERFSRAGQGYKVNVQGHGIGLYVAHQMVEAHGGRIWAESPGPYRGSVFYVELPIK